MAISPRLLGDGEQVVVSALVGPGLVGLGLVVLGLAVRCGARPSALWVSASCAGTDRRVSELPHHGR